MNEPGDVPPPVSVTPALLCCPYLKMENQYLLPVFNSILTYILIKSRLLFFKMRIL